MGEGGRAGAGLIYPGFEAIRLASRRMAPLRLEEALSSLESLKGRKDW